jgi:hypothetical protein
LLASQGTEEFLSSVSPKNLLAKMMKESKGTSSLSLSSDTKKAKDAMSKKVGKNKKGSSQVKVESEDNGDAQTGATGEWALLEREGTFNLYSGKPGSECGVLVDASSYFDRFVYLCISASINAFLPTLLTD